MQHLRGGPAAAPIVRLVPWVIRAWGGLGVAFAAAFGATPPIQGMTGSTFLPESCHQVVDDPNNQTLKL